MQIFKGIKITLSKFSQNKKFINKRDGILNKESTFYLTVALTLLANKERVLFQIILKNEKLISEMRTLLEAFPHGVVIHFQNKNSEESNVFSNEEFNQQIYSIGTHIEELDKVPIVVKNDESEDSQFDSSVSLFSHLRELEERIKLDSSNKDSKIFIKDLIISNQFRQSDEYCNELREDLGRRVF